jgi:hypothetical protein
LKHGPREQPAQSFLGGTFSPALRAFDSPIAIACFLLFTFLPLPLFSLPSFISFISVSTLLLAPLLYLRVLFLLDFLLDALVDFLLAELLDFFAAFFLLAFLVAIAFSLQESDVQTF